VFARAILYAEEARHMPDLPSLNLDVPAVTMRTAR
jgi:hypothetical protein